jgi:hypothetical protein
VIPLVRFQKTTLKLRARDESQAKPLHLCTISWAISRRALYSFTVVWQLRITPKLVQQLPQVSKEHGLLSAQIYTSHS